MTSRFSWGHFFMDKDSLYWLIQTELALEDVLEMVRNDFATAWSGKQAEEDPQIASSARFLLFSLAHFCYNTGLEKQLEGADVSWPASTLDLSREAMRCLQMGLNDELTDLHEAIHAVAGVAIRTLDTLADQDAYGVLQEAHKIASGQASGGDGVPKDAQQGVSGSSDP